jgi:hypothetical protein
MYVVTNDWNIRHALYPDKHRTRASGVCAVTYLRAAHLSTEMKPARSSERQTTAKPRFCWLNHVMGSA